jgi:hypothetical protein
VDTLEKAEAEKKKAEKMYEIAVQKLKAYDAAKKLERDEAELLKI